MKRFLVSIIGRANLGYKGCKLRDHEICCAYVYGKSKAEAISKFWEQLEKNPLISEYYTRRDFKIEAERWESDELNCNGEPLGEWESALPFDHLACAVWNNKTNKLESAEIINKNLKAEMLNEMAEADQAKAERIHDQILETALEKALESNSEAQAEAIQNGKIINPEKKYHVISWRIGAPVDEKTDCGIWDGSGMAHFSEGFGGFAYSSDGWLYFAQEAEEENTAEPDQESAPRMHKTSKRLEIAKAEIDKWNRMAESVKGTNSWALFNLWHDGIDHNGKWFDLGSAHNIRAHMIPHPSDCYFIKKIKGNTWLYFEDCAGIQERWLLSDLAIAFLLPESSQESSSDNSKEIIKKTAEESTESNSKPHSQPVHHLKGAPRLINDSSDDQLASLKAKREQLAKKQHHILERYGNNQESQSIFKEITEIDSQIKRIEFKIGAVVRIVDLDSSNYGEWGIIEKFDGSFYYLAMHGDHEHAPMIIKEEQIELAKEASSAVEFEKVSDYEIKASWNGEKIGKITISYKSYSPVNKVYRVNGNIDEKFEFLDDAKMHLIQNFRAGAHEHLKQLERDSASSRAVVELRNKIDALDDQIAELFIKGAEMRTGKEAE